MGVVTYDEFGGVGRWNAALSNFNCRIVYAIGELYCLRIGALRPYMNKYQNIMSMLSAHKRCISNSRVYSVCIIIIQVTTWIYIILGKPFSGTYLRGNTNSIHIIMR